jgi:hypothetical protein
LHGKKLSTIEHTNKNRYLKKRRNFRKFNLLFGRLEIDDNGFDDLSKEIEKHDIILIDKIKEGQHEDMPINPLTLRAYLKDYKTSEVLINIFEVRKY